MLKSVQELRRVMCAVSIGLFLLFFVLFVLFGGVMVSGLLVFDFFYWCCFGVVCGGLILSGLLLGLLIREIHDELVVEKQKESVVRACYRYHELRSDSRMDN